MELAGSSVSSPQIGSSSRSCWFIAELSYARDLTMLLRMPALSQASTHPDARLKAAAIRDQGRSTHDGTLHSEAMKSAADYQTIEDVRRWPRLCKNAAVVHAEKNRPLRTRCIRLSWMWEWSDDPPIRNRTTFLHSLGRTETSECGRKALSHDQPQPVVIQSVLTLSVSSNPRRSMRRGPCLGLQAHVQQCPPAPARASGPGRFRASFIVLTVLCPLATEHRYQNYGSRR